MLQRPTVVGLLLCEKLIVEEGTKNLSIINSFSRHRVAQFPAMPFPFTVFALLTNGLGDVSLAVAINRLDNLDEVYRKTITARFPDRLKTYQFKLRVADCSFPIAGSYEVNLVAGGEVIAQRKLSIVPLENIS
jgi:hypothetical protein